MVEGGGGVPATAGVDGRGLDDCAAGSDEPVKTLALRKLADRAGAVTAATNGGNDGQMLSYQLEVDVWIESKKPRLIQLDARFQK